MPLSLPRPRAAVAVAFALACLARTAAGQGAGPTIELKSPAPNQVFQRDANGLADIPLVLPDDMRKDAEVQGDNMNGINNLRFIDGKLVGVPAGSYTVHGQVKTKDKGFLSFSAGPFYVGDLWVLAGQSNMEGLGRLVDVEPPHPNVMALGMDGRWKPAEEPLHWLVDSPDPVHSGDPKDRAERSAAEHKSREKGAGLGLPFASAMVDATGVPVGLVICAHGGTSMDRWSPSKRGEGGKSLYGSMLRQVKLAGGKVKGVLWYQGESDARPKASAAYPKALADFIAEVREDFGQPELPFYLVQIGRFISDDDPKTWNAVQEAQRRLPDEVANTAVVAVVDLELDDLIHVGTRGLKRAGNRLARIALRELFGQVGGSTPTLDRVSKGANNTLVVKFKGVNRTSAPARPSGRMMGLGGMPGPGGMMGGMPGAGGGMMAGGMGGMMTARAEGDAPGGLRPDRHIGGFSIRRADGRPIPLIFEARVGPSRDTVILDLVGKPPEGASLWYGWGLDPYCNLTDTLDMAVPAFGPIALDGVK